jgi:hypothetical protein
MSLVAHGSQDVYKSQTSDDALRLISLGLTTTQNNTDVVVELTEKFRVFEITYSNQNKVAGLACFPGSWAKWW